MTAKSIKVLVLASVASLSGLAAGCGEFVRSSQSPTQLVIVSMEVARGTAAATQTFVSGSLTSDVPAPNETLFNDFGRVTMRAIMRDVGTTPTALNDVTINRYRVVYKRSDGRATPGVDVPFAFDGATTFTLVGGASSSVAYELVRHVAKREAPLAVSGTNGVVINMIADVTFYGRDQAGNEVAVTGSVLIDFGNFN